MSFLKGLAIPFALKIRSKVCDLKVTGFVRTFSKRIKAIIQSVRNDKITNSFCNCFLTCLLIQHVIINLVSEKEIWEMCHFPNNVFRIEKRFQINRF